MVPLTFTYLLFVVLLYIAKGVCYFGYGGIGGKCFGVAGQVWWATYQLNNISDAVIYVFGDKHIRQHLKHVCARTRDSVQPVVAEERNNIRMRNIANENNMHEEQGQCTAGQRKNYCIFEIWLSLNSAIDRMYFSAFI